jgi:hypothetical protein
LQEDCLKTPWGEVGSEEVAWCTAREPDLLDGLLAARASMAAEGVTADPLRLIAELDL